MMVVVVVMGSIRDRCCTTEVVEMEVGVRVGCTRMGSRGRRGNRTVKAVGSRGCTSGEEGSGVSVSHVSRPVFSTIHTHWLTDWVDLHMLH